MFILFICVLNNSYACILFLLFYVFPCITFSTCLYSCSFCICYGSSFFSGSWLSFPKFLFPYQIVSIFFLILYSVLVSSLAVTPTDSFMSIAFPFLMIVPSPYFTFLEFLLFLASFFSFHCFLSMCGIPYLLFILSSYQFSVVDLLSFLFLHGILVPLLLLSTCRLFIGATSFIIFIMFFHLFSLFILCWLSTI